MKQSVLKTNAGRLMRGVMYLAITGLAAGCSSNVSRFSDGFYTGSVPKNPPSAVTNPVYQPYPGDVADTRQEIDRSYTGSVNRQAVQPADLRSGSINRNTLPPVGTDSRPALAPVAASSKTTDPVTTGAVARPSQPAESSAPTTYNGWSKAGGTQVTLRSGETIYNLSRRFGVPADAIMKVNGITNASSVSAGQKIVIPTYIYSARASVSAPDNNPKTATARSSRGDRHDVPGDKAPVPAKAPKQQAAVLPKSTEVKASITKPVSGSSAANASSESGTHSVASGESLWGIAQKYGVTVSQLRAANGINKDAIRVGQNLVIPAKGAETTTSGKGVDRTNTGSVKSAEQPAATSLPTYTQPRKTEKVIEKANSETTAATPEKTGVGTMRWPARGRVVSEYGQRNGSKANDGIDISLPSGTPVKAAENGIVIYAGDGLKDFGNTVLVRHEDGIVTVYGHNSQILVARGERVRRGQDLAKSGNSGTADTPKLHFEVRKNSVPVNPLKYLE